MIKKGNIVIVTGGLQGIGREISLAYSMHESAIHVFDLFENGVEELRKEIEERGSRFFFHKVNVSDFKAVEDAIDSVAKESGAIDILVNNAGITKDNLLIGMTEDEWDRVISVNLKGTFNCSKAAVKYMIRKRSGVIINISSVIGIMGNKGQCNYAASKAGIIGFTKSLAKEVGGRNVRVNAIAPGFIETEMTKKLPQNVIDDYSKLIPMGRMGKPKDVADICLFLSSDMAGYITGQVLHIDGGMLM